MLYAVDGDLYRNSGKLDLSSHAYLASIRTSQDSSPKLFLPNNRHSIEALLKKLALPGLP
jgi:hypothetical protein